MLQHLSAYVPFQSVEEMDANIRKHLQDHLLTKSQLRILQCIASHALATPGVAHLKAETIANKLAISTKTVYRAVRLLQELGIIEKVAFTKLNGIKAANIYVICPHVPSEMSEQEELEKPCAPKTEMPKSKDESFSFESKRSSKNNLNTQPAILNHWNEKLQQYFEFYPLQAQLQQPVMDVISTLEMESVQQFERAKQIVVQCIYLITTKQITLYASFEKFVRGAYEKWILPATEEAATVQQPPKSTRPVPFYNWLDERA